MNAIKDWKTTIVGLIVVLVGVGHMLQSGQMDATSMSILTGGVGLILAADSKQ
jgi:hypothetical protein